MLKFCTAGPGLLIDIAARERSVLSKDALRFLSGFDLSSGSSFRVSLSKIECWIGVAVGSTSEGEEELEKASGEKLLSDSFVASSASSRSRPSPISGPKAPPL